MLKYIHSSFTDRKRSPECPIFSEMKSHLKWSLLWNPWSFSNSLKAWSSLNSFSTSNSSKARSSLNCSTFQIYLNFFCLQTLRRRGRLWNLFWLGTLRRCGCDLLDRLEFFLSLNFSKACHRARTSKLCFPYNRWRLHQCLARRLKWVILWSKSDLAFWPVIWIQIKLKILFLSESLTKM